MLMLLLMYVIGIMVNVWCCCVAEIQRLKYKVFESFEDDVAVKIKEHKKRF